MTPLVLLHAFPFDGRMWRRTKVDRQLITPDLRGDSISAMADEVAALLERSGIERAIVGGLSMGGYVSLAFADRHPQRLAGLVLADTKAGPDTPEARTARDEAMELVRAQGVGAYLEKMLPKLLSPNAPAEVVAEARALALADSGTVIAGLGALRDRPDRRPGLPRIACPTLVIVGSEDVVTPPAEAAAMVAAIPGATLVTIPGAGHLANLEAPDAFSSAITAFFG